MSSARFNEEEMKKLTYGEEFIKIKIPKFSDVLIVTTIAKAKNSTANVSTITYTSDEIESMQIDEYEKGERE